MTPDKEALEQQQQSTGKSAIFSPAPSLASLGQQQQPKLASRLDQGSQLVQKSKLILPTTIWILIVVGGLCFLSLLASLNKSINTLDSLVEQEQARVDRNLKDDHKHASPVIGELMSLPPWLSLDRQASSRPMSDNEPLPAAEASIVITGTGSNEPAVASMAGPFGLLGESSFVNPFESMLAQIFSQPANSQNDQELQKESTQGSSFIDKIHINKLNINVNTQPSGGEQTRARPQQSHRRPLRPQAEQSEQGSDGYDKLVDSMLLSMLAPKLKGPQEVGEISISSPEDQRQPRPVPMSPLAQLHLMPFEPDSSMGGPRPHSPLDSSIPPMFGRPQDGHQAHIVIAQFGRPDSSDLAPFRTPSAKPAMDMLVEEPPRQPEIPIRVISNNPDVLPTIDSDDDLFSASSKFGPENSPSPTPPYQITSTSPDDGVDIKPTTNRVTDLFKMFFGEPKDSLVVKPSSLDPNDTVIFMSSTKQPTDAGVDVIYKSIFGEPGSSLASALSSEMPIEIRPQTTLAPSSEPSSGDPMISIPIEPFKNGQDESGTESSEEKKDSEQFVDSILGSMLSLPQMAIEQAPLKLNSTTALVPAIIPISTASNQRDTIQPFTGKPDRPALSSATTLESNTSVSNKSTTSAQTTPSSVGLKADSVSTTTTGPELTTRGTGSSKAGSGSTNKTASTASGTQPTPATTKASPTTSGASNSTTGGSTTKKPDKSFLERADEFIERNLSRFRKFLE